MHYHLQPGTSLFFSLFAFYVVCVCVFLTVDLVGIQLTLNQIQLESVCSPHQTFTTTLKIEEFPPITHHLAVEVATVGVCVWWGWRREGGGGALPFFRTKANAHFRKPCHSKAVMRPIGFPQCQSAKSPPVLHEGVPFKFLFCSQHLNVCKQKIWPNEKETMFLCHFTTQVYRLTVFTFFRKDHLHQRVI